MSRTLFRFLVRAWACGAIALAGCCHTCSRCGSCHTTCRSVEVSDEPSPAPAQRRPAPAYLPPKGPVTASEPPLSEEIAQVQSTVKHAKSKGSNTAANYGHAADYSWLTGELWYVPGKNLWRIHYTTANEKDRYGGIMTLSDAGPMGDYRIGQMVYVEGHPIEGGNGAGGSIYRVNKILELASGPPVEQPPRTEIEPASAQQESSD